MSVLHGFHESVASIELGQEVDSVLENVDTAPVSEEIKATLRFLEKLTLKPNAVDADDVRP